MITSAVRFAQTRSAEAVDFVNRADAKIDLIRNAIRLGILARNHDRRFVRVTRFDTSVREKLSRGNREDPGAGADIEKTAAREVFLNRV